MHYKSDITSEEVSILISYFFKNLFIYFVSSGWAQAVESKAARDRGIKNERETDRQTQRDREGERERERQMIVGEKEVRIGGKQ